MAPEARGLTSRGWQSRGPSGNASRESFLDSASFQHVQVIPGAPGLGLHRSCLPSGIKWSLPCAYFCLCVFSLVRTSVILDQRPTLLQHGLILTNYFYHDPLSK